MTIIIILNRPATFDTVDIFPFSFQMTFCQQRVMPVIKHFLSLLNAATLPATFLFTHSSVSISIFKHYTDQYRIGGYFKRGVVVVVVL